MGKDVFDFVENFIVGGKMFLAAIVGAVIIAILMTFLGAVGITFTTLDPSGEVVLRPALTLIMALIYIAISFYFNGLFGRLFWKWD